MKPQMEIAWVPTSSRFGVEGPFIAPQRPDDYPIWGVRHGIVFGIPPARVGLGKENVGGPRGLFRVGFEEDGSLYFINFLGLNPVTGRGQVGFSELNQSPSDHQAGIRMFAFPITFHDSHASWKDREPPPYSQVATRRRMNNGAQELVIVVSYETFPNGAIPYFVVSLREDRPREIGFYFYHEMGSRPLTRYVLSSTGGSFTRQRDLFLRGRVVNAKRLWPDYKGVDFAPVQYYPLAELRRNAEGDVVFAARPDEAQPWEEPSYPHRKVLTQYFRKPNGTYNQSLQGFVNGRYTYWKTNWEIYNGITYENVGIAEDYRPGMLEIFGYAEGDPENLFQE